MLIRASHCLLNVLACMCSYRGIGIEAASTIQCEAAGHLATALQQNLQQLHTALTNTSSQKSVIGLFCIFVHRTCSNDKLSVHCMCVVRNRLSLQGHWNRGSSGNFAATPCCMGTTNAPSRKTALPSLGCYGGQDHGCSTHSGISM